MLLLDADVQLVGDFEIPTDAGVGTRGGFDDDL